MSGTLYLVAVRGGGVSPPPLVPLLLRTDAEARRGHGWRGDHHKALFCGSPRRPSPRRA
ncbi:MAG: hypothetical protein J6J01_10615 [Oscillospiraceae bacterium]|nr:hypothetical protein [Oscillospiraceae bacterium]MBP3699912.1 hypothetical protein [Oscillospiraceae bacterium]